MDDGRTETLNSVDVGKTQSLEAAEAETGKWEPPACGSFPVALGEMPEGSDPDAWSDTLRDAKQDLRTAKYELDRADRAYTRANNNNSVGVYRERAVQGRKDARENYSQSLCRLPELVEHARRAGVPAGRLRPYEKVSGQQVLDRELRQPLAAPIFCGPAGPTSALPECRRCRRESRLPTAPGGSRR